MKILNTVFFMLLFLTAIAQTRSQYSLLDILPLVTFLIALVTGILNLYVMNKLGKTKEDILIIVRCEFKAEIHELETKMATKEQLDFARRELTLIMENIEAKIDFSIKRHTKNDTNN